MALVPNYNRYLYNRDSFGVRNKCWCPHKNSVCTVFLSCVFSFVLPERLFICFCCLFLL